MNWRTNSVNFAIKRADLLQVDHFEKWGTIISVLDSERTKVVHESIWTIEIDINGIVLINQRDN